MTRVFTPADVARATVSAIEPRGTTREFTVGGPTSEPMRRHSSVGRRKQLAVPAAMLPHQVLPRQFYLITRRCTQRQLLLRPDPATGRSRRSRARSSSRSS